MQMPGSYINIFFLVHFGILAQAISAEAQLWLCLLYTSDAADE